MEIFIIAAIFIAVASIIGIIGSSSEKEKSKYRTTPTRKRTHYKPVVKNMFPDHVSKPETPTRLLLPAKNYNWRKRDSKTEQLLENSYTDNTWKKKRIFN